MQRIGTVRELRRFPVKSMAGQAPVAGEPYPEDGWEGSVVRIGDLRCRLDKRDKRCAIVNVNSASGASNAEVLRAIAREGGRISGCTGRR